MCGPAEPCGLWQSAHVIEPSLTGMCATFAISIFLSVWHFTHRSLETFAWRSIWPPGSRGEWIAWQSTHATRFRAWALLFQWNCSDVRWQVTQTFEASSGRIVLRFRIVWNPGLLLSPAASTCSEPGPWHDSHCTSLPAGLVSVCAPWCGLLSHVLNWSSWQSRQASAPTYVAAPAGAASGAEACATAGGDCVGGGCVVWGWSAVCADATTGAEASRTAAPIADRMCQGTRLMRSLRI